MEKKSVIKGIFRAILVLILFNYSWLLQLIPVFVLNINVEKISDKTNVLLSAFSSALLAIILFIIYRKELSEEFKKFKNNFKENMAVGFDNWIVGLMAMMIFNNIILRIFNGGTAGNEEAVQTMIGAFPGMMLLTAGILAPWNEEIVFRKTLKDIFKNKWLFALTAGFLFGLAHVLGNVSVWTDWLFILPYGSLGVAFALAYYKTDTIFTAMAFHMIHNVLLILLSIM